jgi:alcohol dehydrogenase
MYDAPTISLPALPTALRSGAGILDDVAKEALHRNAQRVALVFDGFFESGEIPKRQIALCQGQGLTVASFFTPTQEPDTQTVQILREALADFAPDLVVAVGGGSTMDAAKVARSTLHRSETLQELASLDADFGKPAASLICVPSTAGTASEVSAMAVVSLKGHPIKLRYRLVHMAADLALLDPALLVGLPASATAETGIDALTHAMEAYISRLANPFSDALALRAVQMLAHALPVAVHHPHDMNARSACLMGSAMAGIAFNSTQLGLVHAISAALGAQADLRHGLANALVLAEVMNYNTVALPEDKHHALAQCLGGDDLRAGLYRLLHGIGLDRGLGHYMDAGLIPAIARASLESGNIATTPRTPTQDDVAGLLRASRSGTM